MECQQEIQDLCAAAAVQIAGRLVRQNQDGSLTSAVRRQRAASGLLDSSAGRCPARSMSPTRLSNLALS